MRIFEKCSNHPIYLYPNPSSLEINVKLESEQIIDSPVLYKIVDSKGEVTQEGKLWNTQESINIEGLQTGVYYFVPDFQYYQPKAFIKIK